MVQSFKALSGSRAIKTTPSNTFKRMKKIFKSWYFWLSLVWAGLALYDWKNNQLDISLFWALAPAWGSFLLGVILVIFTNVQYSRYEKKNSRGAGKNRP